MSEDVGVGLTPGGLTAQTEDIGRSLFSHPGDSQGAIREHAQSRGPINESRSADDATGRRRRSRGVEGLQVDLGGNPVGSDGLPGHREATAGEFGQHGRFVAAKMGLGQDPFVALRNSGPGQPARVDGLLAGFTRLPGDHGAAVGQGQHRGILLIEETPLVDPMDLRTGRAGLQIENPRTNPETIAIHGVVLPDHEGRGSGHRRVGIDLVTHQAGRRSGIGEDANLTAAQFYGCRCDLPDRQAGRGGLHPLAVARPHEADECRKPHQLPR